MPGAHQVGDALHGKGRLDLGQRDRARLAAFALPAQPVVAVLLALAGVGNALLRLGSALIVAANEVRKELRAAERPGPGADQEPGL